MIDTKQVINMILQNSAMSSNPIFQNAYRMYCNKDEKGLKDLAENMCKQRGTDLESVISSLGLNKR